MLLDGHPALSADGGEINFRALPVIDLARTEVVKGAYSALYGSNALGGVVNLITTPVDDRPTTAARAHFDAYDVPSNYRWSDGLLNSQGLELQHSRRLGPMGARAFVGYQGTDGYTQNGAEPASGWRGSSSRRCPTATHQWDAFALYTNEKSQEFLTWRADSLPFEVSPRVPRRLRPGPDVPVRCHGRRHRDGQHAAQDQPVPELELRPERVHREPGSSRRRSSRASTSRSPVRSARRTALRVGGDGAYTWVSSNFIGHAADRRCRGLRPG